MNDWIIANLNNPDFTSQDFKDVLGMDVSNTLILSKDKYRLSSFITQNDAFKNEDGSFSEDKFNQFYNYALSNWSLFSKDEQIDNFEYSLFDPRAKADSRIKNPNFRLETTFNPNRTKIGVAGWQEVGNPTLTPSELALTQKVYDYASGTYTNESPDDYALFNHPLKYLKHLFDDPLVLATYDKDTEEFDPYLGKMVKHKKGEYKLNNEGTYYYETLNGRSISGKQVLSAQDIITVDGSSINKYDFFDSDGLDKSVGGTIAKSVATILPLFIGGPVAEIYGGLQIVRELGKSLPMLYGISTSLFGNENDSEVLNTIAGVGEKFTGGMSEYGKEHMFSFEQFGKLMTDVANQWNQLKLIAKTVSKLRGENNKIFEDVYQKAEAKYNEQVNKLTQDYKLGKLSQEEYEIALIKYTNPKDWRMSTFGQEAINVYKPAAEKLIKRNARLGADASLAYMALVSNYDIYNDMLNRGATHKDASIVALGSTIGMFSVDRFLGLGEMFFDDLEDQAQKTFRNYNLEQSRKYRDIFNSSIGKEIEKESEKGGFFKRVGLSAKSKNSSETRKLSKAINYGRSIAEEFSNAKDNFAFGVSHHALNAGGKALGEGLEEVTEEFVSDVSKQLYEWAGELGYNTSIKDAGAWENWQDRYLMSFLGGAAGGGLFYGVGKYQEAKERLKNPESENAEDETIYLLRQGKKKELIKELDNLHKKGKLGSTKLGINVERDENGNIIYLSANKGEKTLNDLIYDFITSQINQLEAYINNFGANLSDDELFKQMVLGNDRLMQLKQYLGDLSYASGYQNEFQETLKNLINAKATSDIESLKLTDLLKRRAELEKKNENLDENSKLTKESTDIKTLAEKDLEKYSKQLDDFLTGKKSLEYSRKTIFLADPYLLSIWSFNTFDQWLYKKYNKEISDLSIAEKNTYQDEYLKDMKLKDAIKSDDIWQSFLEVEKDFTPYLTSLEENGNQVLKIKSDFEKIQETLTQINDAVYDGILKDDDQLPGESDDNYAHRYDVDETLPQEEREKILNEKILQRKELIKQYNDKIYADLDHLLEQALKVLDIINSSDSIDPVTYRNIKNIYRNFLRKGYIYRLAGTLGIKENVDDFSEKNVKILKKALNNQLDIKIDSANESIKIFNALLTLSPELIDNLTIELFTNPEYEDNLDEDLKIVMEKVLALSPSNEGFIIQDGKIFKEDENTGELLPSDEEELNQLLESYKDLLKNIPEEVINKFREIDDINGLKALKNEIDELISYEEIISLINLAISDQFLYIVKEGNDAGSTTNLYLTDDTKTDLKKFIDEFAKFQELLVIYPFDENNFEEFSIDQINNSYNELKKLLSNKFNIVRDDVNSLIDYYKSKIASSIENNPLYKLLLTINEKVDDINPIKDILINLNKHNIDETNLDLLLRKINDKLFDLVSDEDFSLLDYEENLLRYFDHLLNLASGFIYQASSSPNWLSSFGHAKFINDFVGKNPDVTEDSKFHLPELDADLANYYQSEINKYQLEIRNLLSLHELNAINKKQQEIKASLKFEEVKVKFYKDIANDVFRANKEIRGINLNLLTSDIPDDATSLDIETELANNLMKIINQGVTLTEFLLETQLLEKLCSEENGLRDLKYKEPIVINSNLEKFTPYLKVQCVLSALLYNISKFELENKTNLEKEKVKVDSEKIAPLTSQKYLILSINGFLNNDRAIDEIYKYLAPKIPEVRCILDQCMIISGVAGSGKTNAVIRKSIQDSNLTNEQIWLVGPKKEQAENLKSAINRDSRVFDHDQLMKEISSKCVPNIQLENTTYFTHSVKTFDYKDNGTMPLNNPPDDLKVVIIDEYTYFSSLELQLINRWAKSKNIKILLAGDEHLLGHKFNINDNCCLFLLPKLTVSLREQNIHVLKNNQSIDYVLSSRDKIVKNYSRSGNLSELSDTEKVEQIISELIKNTQLTYYLNNDTFNGTLINKEITPELLNILKKFNVALIGNSNKITTLQRELNIDSDHKFNSIEEIQGREFDYVIFDGNIIPENFEDSYMGEHLERKLKSLYTLNTRGKIGVIIFDDNFSKEFNGLSNIQEYNTVKAKNLSDVVNEFIKFEEDRLNKLPLDGEYHDLTEYKKPFSTSNSSEEQPKTNEEQPKTNEEQPKTNEEQPKTNEETSDEFVDEVKEKINKLHLDEEELKDYGVENEDLNSKFTELFEEQVENLDEEHKEAEQESEKQDIINEDVSSNDDIFDQKIQGYFLPITGDYVKITNEKNEVIYKKLNKNPNSDLGLVAQKLGFKEDLTIELLKQCVLELNNLVRYFLARVTNPNARYTENIFSIWNPYCTIDKYILDFINDPDKQENFYITLEKSEYNPGFKHVGLGTASDSENDLKIYDGSENGDIYRYVLHFKGNLGNAKNNVLYGKDCSITLAFAANPETWKKKQKRLEEELSHLDKNDPEYSSKEEEINTLKKEINNYIKVLQKIKNSESPLRVSIESVFTKLRLMNEEIQHDGVKEIVNRKMRLDTFSIKKRNDVNDTEMLVDSGWKSREGQYKYVSDIFILGKDIDKLGISASLSGKCAVFVSELPIPENSLRDVYIQEVKEKRKKCTVRLLILDNAGINFSTLLSEKYKNLYSTTALSGKSGKPKEFKLPYKSEVTGYRFFASMWNWRADLIKFTDLYKKYFDDNEKENIDKIEHEKYQAILEHRPENIPEELRSLNEKIEKFNTEICREKNIHTFRLGGSEAHVQLIKGYNNVEDYFTNSETISLSVRNHGIFGLYLNIDTASKYLEYIEAIFKTFSYQNGEESIDLNNITVLNSEGKEIKYEKTDNINGHRLHSLSVRKAQNETERNTQKSLRNLLKIDSECDSLSVSVGEEGEEINFNSITGLNDVTSNSFFTQFPVLFTHMCKILWYINATKSIDSTGKIKFKKGGEEKYEFDMHDIKELIFRDSTHPAFGRKLNNEPDEKEYNFEFMNMIDYMFHGTLSDVSTHSLDWKNGKVIGGRDSWTKITGVMYPNGIFCDPRIDLGDANIYKGIDELDGLTMFTTLINPMFLLTGTSTDLVINFKTRFNDIEEEKEKSININLINDKIIYSGDNITLEDVLKSQNITKDENQNNIYFINGEEYKYSENESENNSSYVFYKLNIGETNVIDKNNKKLINSELFSKGSSISMDSILFDDNNETIKDYLDSCNMTNVYLIENSSNSEKISFIVKKRNQEESYILNITKDYVELIKKELPEDKFPKTNDEDLNKFVESEIIPEFKKTTDYNLDDFQEKISKIFIDWIIKNKDKYSNSRFENYLKNLTKTGKGTYCSALGKINNIELRTILDYINNKYICQNI